MLSDKIQRSLMALMLMFVLYFFNSGVIWMANGILIFMIFMICIWAFFDFCPSLWSLKKLFREDKI
jgi:hypothetical protein